MPIGQTMLTHTYKYVLKLYFDISGHNASIQLYSSFYALGSLFRIFEFQIHTIDAE